MTVPENQRTDAELVLAARRGDVAAFEVLYFRHRDFVYRVALRFAREHEAAMDASQEAFAYLLKKLPTLALTGKLSTYLYPIVKNLALTARERGEHRLKLAREHVARPEVAPEAAIPGVSSRLLAAVEGLPEPQREVLLMRVVDEMSVEEVAVATGVPEGTVKSRLHAAIVALRGNGELRAWFEDE